MTQNAYKEIAALFESMVFEASSAADVVRSFPGGIAVVQYLHNQKGLSHAQTYNPITKISWNELKEPQYGTWVLLKCERGTGAIRYNGGNYEAAAAGQTAQVETFSDDRGGNILDFLRRVVGKPQKIWVGNDANAVNALRKKRREVNTAPAAQSANAESIVKKFKPLWVKSLTLAQADIKGMVANMIKNDAYGKASRKLRTLEELTTALDSINSGELDQAPDFVRVAVKNAISYSAKIGRAHV